MQGRKISNTNIENLIQNILKINKHKNSSVLIFSESISFVLNPGTWVLYVAEFNWLSRLRHIPTTIPIGRNLSCHVPIRPFQK